MSLDFTDDQSTLVQVMAWCCQATSHYLRQCWPRSLSPNGVVRQECVNSLVPGRFERHLRYVTFNLTLGGWGICCQAVKLKIFGTRPKCGVSYIAFTKFHSPRPVFHSPSQIFTRIGERPSASFPAWLWNWPQGLYSLSGKTSYH